MEASNKGDQDLKIIGTKGNAKPVILTGDRPTGKLHLGHYVGSLKSRVELQHTYDTIVIIADFQVLTEFREKSHEVKSNIHQIVLDYLGCGLDPKTATVFIQSAVPQLTDLTMYFSMLVNVSRLMSNPTVRKEAAKAGKSLSKGNVAYGFLGYPVSQAADILLFRANLVPVGDDQLPHIRLARDIARTFNREFGKVFPLPKIMAAGTLKGLTGKGKMSKSYGGAIFLSDPIDQIAEKMRNAVTDPKRQTLADPGDPEVCPVYSHHQAFNAAEAPEIAEKCKTASIGCVACKRRCAEALEAFLKPIQARRADFEAAPEIVTDVLSQGTQRARQLGDETMALVRQAVGFDYKALLGKL